MRYVKSMQGRYTKVTDEQLRAMRYIPKNSTPIEEPGLGIVYVAPSSTRPGYYHAIGYVGTAGKSAFNYIFKTDLELDAYVDKFFAGLLAHQQFVKDRRIEYNKPHTFKVGEIITNSWGYDQTNVDWYRVSRTTEHYVWLVPVCANLYASDGCSPMSGTESVTLDENLKPIDKENGQETKHKATGDYCSMKYGSGSRYTGGSLYTSWYA